MRWLQGSELSQGIKRDIQFESMPDDHSQQTIDISDAENRNGDDSDANH
jgi:hypothetical protein